MSVVNNWANKLWNMRFSHRIFQYICWGYDAAEHWHRDDNIDHPKDMRFHHEDSIEVKNQIPNVAHKDGSQQHGE